MVNVTIDGKSVEVPDGTTVLRAAEMAGVTIPTLCDHKHLLPYGGCRLCVVEVEGARTLQPSCTLPVSKNMVVRTDTPKVREARKFVLTLLFSERNHFCMYCQMSGGDCELQNAAYAEDMTNWLLPPNWTPYPMDASHKHFVFDNNRCILCRRCVRACGELVGNFTLGVQERGADTLIIADLGTPLGESTCVSCGTCVQVCPTGALIDRASAYRGREKDVEHIKSTCVGCSVGCGVSLVVRNNRLVRIEGDWEAAVNGGILCEVGRFLPLADERERIMTPLVRTNGALKAATWDEALNRISAGLKPLAGRKGDGVAALASTRLPAEALYLFNQLFATDLGSDMVTSIEEGLTTAQAGAVAQAAGQPFEGDLEALKGADCVVTIGVDLVENHQVAGFFVKRARPDGVKLIVIDPSENGLQSLADCALQPKKGTDADLLTGLMAAIAEMGQAKGEVSGYDVSQKTVAKASQATGISVDEIRAAAQLVAAAQKPVFVYGKGVTGAKTPQALQALLALAKMAGAAVVGVKGQANSLTAYLYGLDKVFAVNGHQAVFLALGDEHPSGRLLQRLEGVPFVAVQASYASPATALADVVLPVAMWAEQGGHYISLDGRVQEAHQGVQAPEDVRSSAEALTAIAAKLGFTLDENWQQALQKRVSTVAVRS
jgi:formate dehydrogenase major subunit